MQSCSDQVEDHGWYRGICRECVLRELESAVCISALLGDPRKHYQNVWVGGRRLWQGNGEGFSRGVGPGGQDQIYRACENAPRVVEVAGGNVVVTCDLPVKGFCSDRNIAVDVGDFLSSDGPEKPCLQEVADEGGGADLVACLGAVAAEQADELALRDRSARFLW